MFTAWDFLGFGMSPSASLPLPRTPHAPKDTQAHLSRLLGANYPCVGFEKDRGTLGGSAFLNPFPSGRAGFPGAPGAADTEPLFGCRDFGISPYEPAAKSSKARPAPGLLLEAQGGRGEESGSGRAAGWAPRQDPALPFPAGMELSPSRASPGKPLEVPSPLSV